MRGELSQDPEHRVRSLCVALPGVEEERAWVGTRWTIKRRNFAHLLDIVDGKPVGHARAVGDDGPITVLMFRASDEDVEAYRQIGRPFFAQVMMPGTAGIRIEDDTDWDEVAELIKESYCLLAPRTLVALVEHTRD